jgi:NADH dehydrogenase
VLVDWAWAYCTHQRNARIVSGGEVADDRQQVR